MALREEIMEKTLEEFNQKNLKFTMDDIAREMGISKKTIYVEFPNKETLFLETIDYYFSMIKESERKIIENQEMDVLTKLKKVLIVLPDHYQNIDFRQITVMKEKFPKIYKKVEEHLGTEWEETIALLNEAIERKYIRPVSIPVFQLMVEGAMQQFLFSGELLKQGITYEEALEEMISVLFNGLETGELEKEMAYAGIL